MVNSMNYLKIANDFVRQKKYAEAIEIYDELLSSCGDGQQVYYIFFNLSKCHAELENYLAARVCFTQWAIYSGLDINQVIKPWWWWCETKSITESTVVAVVPAFNCEDTLVEALDSIFSQTYKDIFVLVVNDASEDGSLNVLKNYKAKKENLYVINNLVNNGPFVSCNIALSCLEEESFGYFFKHDSDDLLLKDRIERQVSALSSPGKALCTSGYTRISKLDKSVISGKNRGHNMTLYSRVVFEELGYYDEVRFGGDSEYLERALLRFGKDSEFYLSERLTLAYLDEVSNLVSQNPLGSPARLRYQENFRNLHLKMKGLESWKFFNTYGVDLKANSIKSLSKELVVCGIATLKNRKAALEDTISSLLPQVDVIYIYQNDYKDISGIFSDPKIVVISALDTGIDMGDAGKFYRLSAFRNCYYFSCDDDLIYPKNYVDKMLSYLKLYDNKVICSCHGRVMLKNPISYYKDKSVVYHFEKENEEPRGVHFGGTGVMAFHTSILDVNFNFFRSANMADVWVGLFSKENNIPITVIPHASKWIEHSDKFDIGTTIFRSTSKKEGIQDCLIKGLTFNEIERLKPKAKIVIGLPTFNRHDFLRSNLKMIDSESTGYDVFVVVNDDGSTPPVKIDDDYKNINIQLISSDNLGKKKYWKTVNKIFDAMSKVSADYYYYMADDLEIVSSFFEKTIATWEKIEDDKKLALNLLNDGREICWTNFQREVVNFRGERIYKSQWLDMIMMFDNKLLSQRVEEVPLNRWEKNPNLSSGVGAQLSVRNHNDGYSMYQVDKSLVAHGDHDSVMNYEERKLNPLLTK